MQKYVFQKIAAPRKREIMSGRNGRMLKEAESRNLESRFASERTGKDVLRD